MMTRSILSIALLATTALTSPALAEITPAEVWEDFRAKIESYGYEVTGTETGGGAQLVVEDVVMNSMLPEGDGALRIDLGQITLNDTGDTVSVVFEDSLPILFAIEFEPGVVSSGRIDYVQNGFEMTVTGSANAPRYDYAAEDMRMTLSELVVDGDPVGRDQLRFDMTFSDIVGTMTGEVGANRAFDQTFAAADISYDVFFTAEDNIDQTINMTGSWTETEFTGSSSIPTDISIEERQNPFKAGLTGNGTMSHQGGTFNVSLDDQGDTSAFNGTSEGGNLTGELTETGITYDIATRGVTMQMASADLPFPLAIEAQEMSLSMGLPMVETPEAEPFDLKIALQDYEMAENVWSLFDPSGALPRDPATLNLALSGTMRWLVDLMDEQAMVEMGATGTVPAEVETLNLDDLTLKAAGALLTGTGGFTFDQTDKTTFGGIAAPEGEVTLELVGANKLLDTLVSMGLLPQEQAMGARMMMAMFAQPAGDDTLRSRIEINENGHVLANGQRLQ